MGQYKIVKRMRKIMKAGHKATVEFYENRKRENPNKSNDKSGTESRKNSN
jgi:ribulose bisphosphate carboxylase small subunit